MLVSAEKLLKRAYYGAMQRPSDLAEFFQVSQPAVLVRLRQTGITDPTPSCAPSSAPFSRSWRYGPYMQGV
ncbi:MAG: ImmA/IrrE family metallo-endopeptidase [Thermoleophilia bacterium]|nr:ImmA/IrrE family metallo-endopeptidase [Thermoleophilia bacterium]